MLHVCLPIYLSIYPSTYQSINLSFSYHLHFSGTRFSSPVQQWQSWNECRCLGWKLLVLVNKGWEMDDHPKKDLIFCLNMFNLDIFKRYMVLLMLCLNMFNLKTIYIYICDVCLQDVSTPYPTCFSFVAFPNSGWRRHDPKPWTMKLILHLWVPTPKGATTRGWLGIGERV